MLRLRRARAWVHAARYDSLPVDKGVWPAFGSVTLQDGKEYHTERIYPVGHLTDPIPDQVLKEKFLRCANPILGEKRAKALCQSLWGLENCTVPELMHLTLPA